MDYTQTLSYLDQVARSGVKLGLENIHRLLHCMGSPQNEIPAIHIGGSNGKGSVAAFLSSILTEAGYHVGTYTSPHLVSVEERVALDHQPIAPEAFAAAATHLRETVERLLESKQLERQPTYFELLTAIAFHVFRSERCDLQVLEVGMGGRLDATNVVEKPLLCVVTRIDLEHSKHLGETLESIAAEKAAIARPGVPTLTFERRAKTLDALRDTVRGAGATLIDVARELAVETDDEGTRTLRVGRSTFRDLTVPLPGDHQIDNLALALRAVELLGARGFPVSEAEVQLGVQNTRWPGRLELVRTNPTLLLDGAHNPAGARALAACLDSIGSDGDLYVVFGAMEDKDIPGIMKPILPRACRVFLTRSPMERAAELPRLETQARKHNENVTTIAEPGRALAEALALARPQDTILVTGSLILIGDVKKHLAG